MSHTGAGWMGDCPDTETSQPLTCLGEQHMRLIDGTYARSSAYLGAIDSICSMTSLIASGCLSGG